MSDREHALVNAVRRHDLFQLQALLRDRADPNTRNVSEETVLLEAAATADLDAVALLLAHAANPASVASQGIPGNALSLVATLAGGRSEASEKALSLLDPGVAACVRQRMHLGEPDVPLSTEPTEKLWGSPLRLLEDAACHTVVVHLSQPSRPLLELRPLGRRPSAAVVLLHGLLQSGAMLERICRQLSRALPHAVLLAPTAPTMPSIFGPGPSWFDTLGGLMWPPRRLEVSRLEVCGLLGGELVADVPLERVAILGFSQGGTLAAWIALQLPRPLATVVLAGTEGLGTQAGLSQSFGGSCASGVKVLQCHGGDDQMVPAGKAQLCGAALRRLGLDVEFSLHDGIGHTISADMVAKCQQWLVELLPNDERCGLPIAADARQRSEARAAEAEARCELPIDTDELQLCRAAREGNADELKSLLRGSADPNGGGITPEVPLLHAARQGGTVGVALLLLGKADAMAISPSMAAFSCREKGSMAFALLRLACGFIVPAQAQERLFLDLDDCSRFLLGRLLALKGVRLAVSDVLSDAEWRDAVTNDGDRGEML